jgi:putative copper export protein
VWADVLRAVFLLAHVGASAVWLGAMVYSMLVVQPRLAQFFNDADEREDFATLLAAGARWKVLGLAATLALSGAGLTAIEIREADSPSTAWTSLIVAKCVLLAAAVVLFAYVSWRLWPARLLAHLSRSPDLRRIRSRFSAIALALTVLIAAGLVAGVLADAVR